MPSYVKGRPPPFVPGQRGPPRHARPNRSHNISIAFIIFAIAIWFASRSEKAAPFSRSRPLPTRYALCTTGKHVYTVPADDDGGGVGATECVVVENKRIVDSGSLGRIRRTHVENGQLPKGQRLKLIHLPPGYAVTPGLTDAHAHPLEYGHSRRLQLLGSASIEEAVKRVEAVAAEAKDGWVEGMGWDQNMWQGKQFPTAADLDTPALRGRSISLKRIDVHAEWVSRAVLDQLGPLPDTIPGGQIVRDAHGAPTGVFIDNAIDLIDAIRPPWTDARREEYLGRTVQDCLAKGMVGVHDAGVLPSDLAWYRRMANEGKLKMRFYTMILCGDREQYCGDTQMVDGAGDGRLTVKSVKLFGDGALGSRGAALLEDYSDQPGWRGFMLQSDESWAGVIKRYYDDVNVHCIGDRANHVVLDAMQAAIGSDTASGRARRLRIEHAQIMTLPDLKRAAEMGDRLGPERIKGAYAWQTYLQHGGRVALGSDFPVESPDPLRGFYAAVTRRAEDGTSPHGSGGWYPDERLSREQALRGFTVDRESTSALVVDGSALRLPLRGRPGATTWVACAELAAAYAAFSNDTGSLTPGKRADLVVWDDDLMTVDADEMLDVKVVATVIDGEIVYGSIS